MKKQILVITFMLSATSLLHTNVGHEARSIIRTPQNGRFNRMNWMTQMQGTPISQEFSNDLTQNFISLYGHPPKIGDFHTNSENGGASQTYRYEGDNRWVLLWYSHGLQVRRNYKNFPFTRISLVKDSPESFMQYLKQKGQSTLLEKLNLALNSIQDWITLAKSDNITPSKEVMTRGTEMEKFIAMLTPKLTRSGYETLLLNNKDLLFTLLGIDKEPAIGAKYTEYRPPHGISGNSGKVIHEYLGNGEWKETFYNY